MREETCSPSMAKGALLAERLTVGGATLARGRPVGDEVISLLNAAGVAKVRVIKVGIGDILADAAVNHVSRKLSGPLTLYKPSRGGQGGLLAARVGLLDYDESALKKAVAAHGRYTIEAEPPHTLLKAGAYCATVRTEEILMDRAEVFSAVEDMPETRIHPCGPVDVALVTLNKGKDKFLEDEAKRMTERFGSEVKERLRGVRGREGLAGATAKAGSADLVLCHLSKADMGLLPEAADLSSPAWEDGGRLLVGLAGRATYVAFGGKGVSGDRVRKAVDFVHAGLDPAKAGKPGGEADV